MFAWTLTNEQRKTVLSFHTIYAEMHNIIIYETLKSSYNVLRKNCDKMSLLVMITYTINCVIINTAYYMPYNSAYLIYSFWFSFADMFIELVRKNTSGGGARNFAFFQLLLNVTSLFHFSHLYRVRMKKYCNVASTRNWLWI